MTFSMTQSVQDDQLFVSFAGPIDESTEFNSIEPTPHPVVIDLSQVTSINSVGIKAWITWFEQYKDIEFEFVGAPQALVMQMNMVQNFLPNGSHVKTLQLPFYCDSCDKEFSKLVEVGKDVTVENDQVKITVDPSIDCENDCEIELDVNESKYFRFLFSNQDN